jgi:hypothetical protein
MAAAHSHPIVLRDRVCVQRATRGRARLPAANEPEQEALTGYRRMLKFPPEKDRLSLAVEGDLKPDAADFGN